MKTIQLYLTAALLMIGGILSAQSTGIIRGTLTDEKGSPLLFATVALLDDTTIIAGVNTDDKGDFTMRDITPGKYNVQLSYTGYITLKIKNVVVSATQIAYLNRSLSPGINMLKEAVVTETYQQTIINPTFSTVTSISIDQITDMAVTPGDIVGLIVNVTPGVMPTDDGKDLYMRGSRRGTTEYIVDGEKIYGSSSVPGLSISGMEVLTGGVPAEYGDCTGGIVIITTKDYKTEMRRKEIAKRERAENEDGW